MSEGEMTFQEFANDPWKNADLHRSYKNSFLGFSNAPEYAPSEVLLASLYRQIGFQNKSGPKVSESDVGKNGTALSKAIQRQRKKGVGLGALSSEGWGRVVEEAIRSPRQPNQKAKVIQMTPIVPSCSIYSMAARQRGNPWNPGGLIESCVSLGTETQQSANETWESLFNALSVTTNDDDVWALFLEEEFNQWKIADYKWEFSGNISFPSWVEEWQKQNVACPANRFAKDLKHIIQAKKYLTRRQWSSVLESTLRLGLGSHVLWVLKANTELHALTESVLQGSLPPSKEELKDRLATGRGFWTYEQTVGTHLKKIVRNYLIGRVALNLLLYRCREIELLNSIAESDPLRSIDSTHAFLQALYENREVFDFVYYQTELNKALDSDPRKILVKQGIGKNLVEFLEHSLRQRETHERGLENYDQGYLLSRRGSYSRAPWILAAGPVMILNLAYCCVADGVGVRTVEDLCKHFSEYGIRISPDEVSDSKLGVSLRTLGLVIDSPDAEGGMVLLNPFFSEAEK